MPDRITRREVPGGIVARAASFVPETVDTEARTVRVLWSTGATRRTFSWEDGEVDESLDLDGADLGAWDGAPVLDAHRHYGSALDTLGTIEAGTTTRTKEGLESTVRFARTEEGNKALALVADGITQQWSVGYDNVRYERVAARDRTDVKGAQVPLYIGRSFRPRELSLVPIAADPGARTRSSDGDQSPIVIEERQMPDTKTTQTEAERAAELQAIKDAAIAEERERVATRSASLRQTVTVLGFDDVDADELARGTRSLEDIRTELIQRKATEQEKSRTAGAGHFEAGEADVDKRRGAMVASILHRANPANEKFAAADGANEYRGSLVDTFRAELHARGVHGALKMPASEIARLVIVGRAGSGMTLSDLPNVFLDAMHKAAVEAYEATERHYRNWARQSNYRDFRDHHLVRLSDLVVSRTPKVEGGGFTQVKFSDKRNKSALDTYGLWWDITDRMIVNDDLDAFSQAPDQVADGFADLENYIMYQFFEANPALVDTYDLFGSEHANILGTYGKPGSTLAAAIAEHTWSTPAGKTRKFMYQHVIVPTTYAWEAEQYYNADWAPATQSEARPRSVRGKTVTVSEYLSDGAWYTAQANSGITFGYLDGQEGIQTAEEFRPGELAYRMYAWSHFAGGVRDHVGLLKILETSP